MLTHYHVPTCFLGSSALIVVSESDAFPKVFNFNTMVAKTSLKITYIAIM